MFVGLREAIDTLAELSSIDDLAELLALSDRLQAHVSVAVDRFARDGAWQADGATSMVAWLAHHSRLSRGHAGALVRTAAALREMPVLAEAWTDGRLSSDQTNAVARTVDPRVAARFNEVAPDLIDNLAGLSVRDVQYVTGVWNERATAGLDEPAPSLSPRNMSFAKMLDDVWHGTITLDADDGEIVNAAIDAAITRDDPDSGDPVRTVGQRRADALVEVCRQHLERAARHAAGHRRRPHLNVTATLDDLCHGGPGRHVNGGVIPSTRLREYACDASVHRVVTDAHGVVLDYGHATRTVPTSLWNALVVRDEHCRYPGCDRPVDWCEAHHVRHWIDGGPTALLNLVLLCSRHHHRCHEPGWHACLAHDATFTVRTVTGRTMTSRPRAPALRFGG